MTCNKIKKGKETREDKEGKFGRVFWRRLTLLDFSSISSMPFLQFSSCCTNHGLSFHEQDQIPAIVDITLNQLNSITVSAYECIDVNKMANPPTNNEPVQ